MGDDIKHKTCSACNESKPIECYGLSPMYKGGRRHQCTSCRGKRNKPQPKHLRKPAKPESVRRYLLRVRYGISDTEYQRMLADQAGQCAICGGTDPKNRYGMMCVDHCHTTGAVRSLLCNPCNLALGVIERAPACVESFSLYLRAHARI